MCDMHTGSVGFRVHSFGSRAVVCAASLAPSRRRFGEQRGPPRGPVEGRSFHKGSYRAPRGRRLRDAVGPQKRDAPLDASQLQELQRSQGAPGMPSIRAPRDLSYKFPAARLGSERAEAGPDAQ